MTLFEFHYVSLCCAACAIVSTYLLNQYNNCTLYYQTGLTTTTNVALDGYWDDYKIQLCIL